MGLRRKIASFCLKMVNFDKFYNDFNDLWNRLSVFAALRRDKSAGEILSFFA